MTKKEAIILLGNLVLAVGLFVLVGFGKISWTEAGAGLTLLAFPSVGAIMKKAPDDPVPPGPALALIALALGGSVVLGCATLRNDELQAESAYLGEQLACVEESATIEDSRECRRKVRERWGITETVTKHDAGGGS